MITPLVHSRNARGDYVEGGHEEVPITVIEGMLVLLGTIDMPEWLKDPNIQLTVGLLVLCILIAGGFSLVSRFRDYAAQDGDEPIDALAKLEEMHLKGDISEMEFRTIQAKAVMLSQRESSDEVLTSADEPSVS